VQFTCIHIYTLFFVGIVDKTSFLDRRGTIYDKTNPSTNALSKPSSFFTMSISDDTTKSTADSARMRLLFRATALIVFVLTLTANYLALAPASDVPLYEGTSSSFNQAHSELIPATVSQEGKNLVAFVALGSKSSVAIVHHNINAHFLGWDCIVFVHKDESEISPHDPMVKEIGSKCSIVRLPGLYWSHFLMTITPHLTQQYEYIAVVLDDLFAPVHGDSAVNMTKLLQQMKQYNLSSISPSIKGAVWPATLPQEPCLWQVHLIETFFQIFSRDLFNCWRSAMHFSNRQGWCLDICLEEKLCPSISRLAVDATMIAYHVGNSGRVQDFVPESVLVGVNLSRTMNRRRTRGDMKLCERLNCSLEIPNSEQLQCDP
jgi:hypothetical protein